MKMSTNQQEDGKNKACSHEPEVTVTTFHGWRLLVLPYIALIHTLCQYLILACYLAQIERPWHCGQHTSQTWSF